MKQKLQSTQAKWWFLGLVLLLQTTVLLFAPNEKTLAMGIKPVYLHVSLTWAGMILLMITGLLGLVLLAAGGKKLAHWQRTFFLSALWLYGSGFAISIMAAWVNWGGIPFAEPKIKTAINVIVAAVACWILREWVPIACLKGLIGALPVAFMLFSVQSSRVVLHPDNPVNSSPPEIMATFYLMFGLAILLSIWLIWILADTRKTE